ncbi:MAG: hypothetical protein OXN89_25355 [Bryobacterales bacterium]|nr:hypothetical protein [Bryobacterales bacterium]
MRTSAYAVSLNRWQGGEIRASPTPSKQSSGISTVAEVRKSLVMTQRLWLSR